MMEINYHDAQSVLEDFVPKAMDSFLVVYWPYVDGTFDAVIFPCIQKQ
jgi:hypothetical protein